MAIPQSVRDAITWAREVFGDSDPSGDRLGIVAPEDEEVRALCERIGYGAVMDSAARQWRLKDPVGALTVGSCVAVLHLTISRLTDALER